MAKYEESKDFQDLEAFFFDKINGAFSAYDMMALKTGTDRFPENGTYVEIGTQYGRSFYVASLLLPKSAKMYAVDIFDPGHSQDSLSRQEFFDQVGLSQRASYTAVGSDKAAAAWDGTPIDMMFIDGDHSYKGVKADVSNWGKFVRSGGYIYFHDADETSPGVKKLVKQLAKSDEWEDLTFYKDTTGHRTSVASVRKI